VGATPGTWAAGGGLNAASTWIRSGVCLAKLMGPITLTRDGHRLVAKVRGNPPALLELNDELYNRGAGSPSHTPASTFLLVA